MNKLHSYFLLFLSLLICNISYAQSGKELPAFSEDSIYVFKAVNLSDLDPYKMIRINDLDLSEPAASYAVKETIPSLPRGHYWQVLKAEKDIHFRLYTVDEFNYAVVRHTNNPKLFFYDNEGRPLKDVSVYYQNKVYKADPETHLIRLENVPKSYLSFVANNNGVKYNLEIRNDNKVSQDIPHLSGFNETGSQSISSRYDIEYRCGDTILIDRDITGHDYVNFYNQSRELLYTTTIKKEKKHDKIHLKSIILSEECPYLKEGKVIVSLGDKQNVYRYNNRLAEFNYVSRKYKLETDISEQKHLRNKPPVLTLNVTEPCNEYSEKDYIVIEGTVRTTRNAARDSVYIPVKLFKDTILLEINKNIEYSLPNLFPYADIDYKLEVSLYRDNKRARNEVIEIQSLGTEEMFVFSKEKNKLFIEKVNNKESLPENASVDIFGKSGHLFKQELELPCSLKLNPLATYYRVSSENLKDSVFIKPEQNCPVEYSILPHGSDSSNIIIESLGSNPFWYTIWDKNNILKQGYTKQVDYKVKKAKDGHYVLRLEYMEAGDIYELQTRLRVVKPKVRAVKKAGISINSNISVFSYDYKWKEYGKHFLKHTSGLTTGKSVYEEILNLLEKSRNYSYSPLAKLYLSYKNEKEHKARYVMLVDTTKTDLYDKIDIYRVGRNPIHLPTRKEYMMYILSDSTFSCKRTIRFNKEGLYHLKLNMNNLSDSDKQWKEVNALLSPFKQKKKVRVEVFDSQYNPAIGATVVIEGTTIAAMTDIDGYTTLEIPAEFKGDIEIRYLGMRSKRIKYKGQSTIEVRLEDEYGLSD